MTFKLAASPHTHQKRSTQQVMRWVYLCMIPGIILHHYFFGAGVWLQMLLALIVGLSAEAIAVKLRGRSIRSVWRDHTTVVTALLLAVSIPSLAPWWVISIGMIFAIVVVKQVYGGVGQNLFNPAMAGYVVLLISFPVQMSSWPLATELAQQRVDLSTAASLIFSGYTPAGYSLEQLRMGVDGLTMATPLDALRNGLTAQFTTPEIFASQAIFGAVGGIGWGWLNLAWLAGGLILVQQRIISWHIPVGVLLGLAVPAAIFQLFNPDTSIPVSIHLLSGATMLGAFFIATDPVSAATSNRGRLWFGLLIGVLVFIIRSFGGYPDGMAFAVLLANMCVPIIDKYTQPIAYGHGGKS